MAARTGDPTKEASANATATSQSAPVVEAEDDIPFQSNAQVVAPAAAPAAPAAPAAATGGASDILAMIRARQQG
tara:strand:+ start:554 stop:775 length:222 start_codon:yes stop_codon:yes gene_type:complete